MHYLRRRLVNGLLLLFLVSVLSFLLAELVPGDFLSQMRIDPQISQDTVDALRLRYGLDDSLPQRYGRWAGSLLRGELGFSFVHNRPVTELVLPRVGKTLLLTLTATALAWLIALPWGAFMASRPGGIADRTGLGITALLAAAPDLLLGLGALLLAARTGWFPVGGMSSLGAEDLDTWGRLRDTAHHLVLPATALALAGLPTLVRHVRAAFAEALAAPHILAARGHGIGPRRLLFAYALPSAAVPLTTLFGLSLGSLLSGSLIIEVILSWPGLGPLFLDAILGRDLHVILGVTLLSGGVLILGQLIADMLLFLVDPRIRTGAS